MDIPAEPDPVLVERAIDATAMLEQSGSAVRRAKKPLKRWPTATDLKPVKQGSNVCETSDAVALLDGVHHREPNRSLPRQRCTWGVRSDRGAFGFA